jgi:short-subunit dehydrogenase
VVTRAFAVLVAELASSADLARVETALAQDGSISLPVNNAGVGTHTAARQRWRHDGHDDPPRSIVAIAPELLNGVYGGSKEFMHAFSGGVDDLCRARAYNQWPLRWRSRT